MHHARLTHSRHPKNPISGKYVIAIRYLFALLTLAACDPVSSPRHSDNRTALLNLVKLDLPIGTARWEVFGTPEYTGGVPGPTDYVTLIAEVAPAIPAAGTNTGETAWITPGVARPWLSPDFKSVFAQHSNSNTLLSHVGDCRSLHATLTKSGEKVQGFLCSGKASSVVYLTLYSSFE